MTIVCLMESDGAWVFVFLLRYVAQHVFLSDDTQQPSVCVCVCERERERESQFYDVL